jgi:hypothetical protein
VFEHWATRRANRLRAARWSLTVANVAELVIRPVDPHDDADMDGFQRVYAAAERAEDPGSTRVGMRSRC